MKDALREVFAKYQDSFSGTILAKNEHEVFFSVANGYANRDFEIPNRLDTKFDVASVTKTFTAVAVLQVISRGLLRLNDHITDVIDLRGTKIPDDVTIEQLMNHTSGIADDADEEAGESYEALFIDKPNYSIRNCIDLLPQFAYKDPVFKAGTNVRYNNCAFVLQGLAIEQVTGMEYRSFVYENILKPANLTNTAFLAKDEVCPNAAEGYFPVHDADHNFVKWKKNIYSYPPIGSPDGGIYTTVEDLDTFLRALKAGALLPEMETQAIFQPHCAFTRPARHGIRRTGYGFEFIERDGKILSMHKEGGSEGVDAMFSYFPQHDLSLNVLSNENGPMWALYNELRDVIARL